jgi:hypothetical protein
MSAMDVISHPWVKSVAAPFLLIVVMLAAYEYSRPNRPSEPKWQTTDPPPPNNKNEEIAKRGRDYARESTLRALNQSTFDLCQRDGVKQVSSAVTHYFGQRLDQERSYEELWGNVGRSYIRREWSTSDDSRIERLIQENYERGYLNLATLRPKIAKRVSEVVAGSRVSGTGCKAK